MKICAINRPATGSISDEYDLVLVASGYESRARYIAEKSALIAQGSSRGTTRVAIGFLEHKEAHARKTNDAAFHALGYSILELSGSSNDAGRIFIDSLRQLNREKLKVLIDVTSMTRAWYGSIIKCLAQERNLVDIEVHFAYTPSQYTPPSPSYPPNRIVAPIPGFIGNTLPDKPTALIVGVGYDRDRAIGLKDYLDPQLTFAFYANPSTDLRFAEQVKQVNRDFFNELPENHQYTYPIQDPVATFKLIESVANGLRHDWRVVLCSLGPKTFSLCCFLLATLYRDLSIWRVSADQHQHPVDHHPLGEPIVLHTSWRPNARQS